jgi:Rrf2 family protein
MKLTRKGEYAIRAMIALGRSGEDLRTIQSIAAEQKIPKKFLEQILLALKAAGLVTSKAGPRGGYKLVRMPAAISLGAILDAVDEPLARGTMHGSRRGEPTSPVEKVLGEIRQCVAEHIQHVSLAELVAEETTHEQVTELMWYI